MWKWKIGVNANHREINEDDGAADYINFNEWRYKFEHLTQRIDKELLLPVVIESRLLRLSMDVPNK